MAIDEGEKRETKHQTHDDIIQFHSNVCYEEKVKQDKSTWVEVVEGRLF